MIGWLLGMLGLALLLSGCGPSDAEKAYERRLWEDGVFWGAEAVRSGAKPDEETIRAYELREQARRQVAADDEAIRKIQGTK